MLLRFVNQSIWSSLLDMRCPVAIILLKKNCVYWNVFISMLRSCFAWNEEILVIVLSSIVFHGAQVLLLYTVSIAIILCKLPTLRAIPPKLQFFPWDIYSFNDSYQHVVIFFTSECKSPSMSCFAQYKFQQWSFTVRFRFIQNTKLFCRQFLSQWQSFHTTWMLCFSMFCKILFLLSRIHIYVGSL